MSIKQIKTVLVVCKNPTSTLTKGNLYAAIPVRAHIKKCHIWYAFGRLDAKRFKDAYTILNDHGNSITVLASRFKLKK